MWKMWYCSQKEFRRLTDYAKKYIFGCLFFLLALGACERDDICAASTPTTPQLVIAFLMQTTVPSQK